MNKNNFSVDFDFSTRTFATEWHDLNAGFNYKKLNTPFLINASSVAFIKPMKPMTIAIRTEKNYYSDYFSRNDYIYVEKIKYNQIGLFISS